MTFLFLSSYFLFIYSCIHACSLIIIYQNFQEVLSCGIKYRCSTSSDFLFLFLFEAIGCLTLVCPVKPKWRTHNLPFRTIKQHAIVTNIAFRWICLFLQPCCIPLHGSSLVFICKGTTALNLRLGCRLGPTIYMLHMSISRKMISLHLHHLPAS